MWKKIQTICCRSIIWWNRAFSFSTEFETSDISFIETRCQSIFYELHVVVCNFAEEFIISEVSTLMCSNQYTNMRLLCRIWTRYISIVQQHKAFIDQNVLSGYYLVHPWNYCFQMITRMKGMCYTATRWNLNRDMLIKMVLSLLLSR